MAAQRQRRLYRPMTIRTAVAKSVNAVAVRVVDELTPRAAYDFLTEQLDFSHLNAADIDLAPMALGGMNGGVTVREMAAGFSIFLNDGIFNGARTYTKVLNSDGHRFAGKRAAGAPGL